MQEEVSGGRGTANVVGKCKGCRKDYSVSVLNDKLATYDVQDSGKFKTIVAFECRGVELAAYKPSGNWQCELSRDASRTTATMQHHTVPQRYVQRHTAHWMSVLRRLASTSVAAVRRAHALQFASEFCLVENSTESALTHAGPVLASLSVHASVHTDSCQFVHSYLVSPPLEPTPLSCSRCCAARSVDTFACMVD
jgi:hypothetical protein